MHSVMCEVGRHWNNDERRNVGLRKLINEKYGTHVSWDA